ncbi:MAG TPA: CarD family transcriptional regulator, partial [Candidatus Limnocylindrales bacterium]|nr:CarD family transcriptional regulator [Candidatus Limnocylindrales bacterium]
MSSSPPMRGRRGWERRLAERESAVDQPAGERPAFDSAEAEIEAHATAEARAEESRKTARSAAARGPETAVPKRQGAGRRIPNLAALPVLLEGTGGLQALAERLGLPAAPASTGGRHAGVTSVPHGAKSYLAAALALVAGERIAWIARDSEIGDRVAEELGAWVGDPATVAVLEPRTALAYERSELVADETAARVAALSAWRSGQARILVASVQALIQHTLAPEDLPEAPLELTVGARVAQSALLRELLDLGYTPVFEVAGRGEFARRGGIVDVFPPSAELPVRIESFGDEIESLRAFDPTDQRTTGKVERVALLPASEFLVPASGVADLRDRVGKIARKLPDRLAQDLERLGSAEKTRAVNVGDAAEVWAPLLAPSTALDHLDPATLFVLDEPGDVAQAAEFLWRQADERRADLLGAGELPRDWPSTLLGRRDWKRRLLAARTLELTWESEASDAIAGGGKSSGDLFGWREPVLPPGRGARIAEAVGRWLAEGGAAGKGSGESRARVVIASDQAPRLAELLEEGGHGAGVTDAIAAAPPAGSVTIVDRSLNGGFAGGPDGLVFVTDRELFGNVRVRRPKAMRRVVPRDILERLTPGDLVVHIDHGIARYEKMLRRSSGSGDERDFLELAFQGQDRIYVPVEQIGRISRYSGGESPHLSKLGGTEWLRTKQRVARAVGDLAEELLALYAARADAPGHAYLGDSPWQAEMEAAFPYEETVDQLRAAVEVKHDMEAVRPMDRLVVGDVGYGKTEIA